MPITRRSLIGAAAVAKTRRRPHWNVAHIKFDWTNQRWGDQFAPAIRTAIVIVSKTHQELAEQTATLARGNDEEPARLFDWLYASGEHLEGCAELLKRAAGRVAFVSEAPKNHPKRKIRERPQIGWPKSGISGEQASRLLHRAEKATARSRRPAARKSSRKR